MSGDELRGFATIQVRKGGGLDQGGSARGSKSMYRVHFEDRISRIHERLDEECERKARIKADSRVSGLTNWKESCIFEENCIFGIWKESEDCLILLVLRQC